MPGERPDTHELLVAAGALAGLDEELDARREQTSGARASTDRAGVVVRLDRAMRDLSGRAIGDCPGRSLAGGLVGEDVSSDIWRDIEAGPPAAQPGEASDDTPLLRGDTS